MKKLMLSFIFCLLFLPPLNAQIYQSIANKSKDTIKNQINNGELLIMDSLEIYNNLHISLDIGYGFDIANSKVISGNFNNMGSWNLFLNVGNFKTIKYDYFENATGLKHYFITALGWQFSNSYAKLSLSKPDDEKISMSVFKTNPKIILAEGFGSEDFKVVPYVALPFFGLYSLNRITYNVNLEKFLIGDGIFLNKFIRKINFGCNRESGVMLHINRTYNLYLSYENLIAYPKLLMGKDIGMTFVDVFSWTLIYAGTINLLCPKVANEFKPTLLSTLVNFVLQNAYMLTTQNLRRDNMNWPFSSSKSINLQTLSLNFGYIL